LPFVVPLLFICTVLPLLILFCCYTRCCCCSLLLLDTPVAVCRLRIYSRSVVAFALRLRSAVRIARLYVRFAFTGRRTLPLRTVYRVTWFCCLFVAALLDSCIARSDCIVYRSLDYLCRIGFCAARVAFYVVVVRYCCCLLLHLLLYCYPIVVVVTWCVDDVSVFPTVMICCYSVVHSFIIVTILHCCCSTLFVTLMILFIGIIVTLIFMTLFCCILFCCCYSVVTLLMLHLFYLLLILIHILMIIHIVVLLHCCCCYLFCSVLFYIYYCWYHYNCDVALLFCYCCSVVILIYTFDVYRCRFWFTHTPHVFVTDCAFGAAPHAFLRYALPVLPLPYTLHCHARTTLFALLRAHLHVYAPHCTRLWFVDSTDFVYFFPYHVDLRCTVYVAGHFVLLLHLLPIVHYICCWCWYCYCTLLHWCIVDVVTLLMLHYCCCCYYYHIVSTYDDTLLYYLLLPALLFTVTLLLLFLNCLFILLLMLRCAFDYVTCSFGCVYVARLHLHCDATLHAHLVGALHVAAILHVAFVAVGVITDFTTVRCLICYVYWLRTRYPLVPLRVCVTVVCLPLPLFTLLLLCSLLRCWVLLLLVLLRCCRCCRVLLHFV